MPDGQSVKLDKAVSVGGQLKVKYTGKPFKQTCSVMRTRNESLIQSVTEQYVKNSDLKEKLYGYVSISKDLPARIDVYYRDMHVCSEGAVVQPAQKRRLQKRRFAGV